MPLTDAVMLGALGVAVLLTAPPRDGWRRSALIGTAALALGLAAFALGSLRWQAAPGLAVAAIALAIGLWTRRRKPLRDGIVAGMLALGGLLCAALYYFFPVFDLPEPDGGYGVGVRDIELRDASRRGVQATAGNAPRDLPVTIWYPADRDAKGARRPYWTRQEAWDEGRSAAELWGLWPFRFLSLHSTGTHGIVDAPAAAGRFPVVMFSHGYWSFRAQNTALMEKLASHGYIVVSVSHPRDGVDVRLRSGRLVPVAAHFGPGGIGKPEVDARLEHTTTAFMGGASHAARIAALPDYRAAIAAHRLGDSMKIWRDDMLFVSRRLQAAPPGDAAEVMRAGDFGRLAYAGMSFGGSVSPSACDADPRCGAAINLDGENFDGAQFDREVRAPLLLMLTDQKFSRAQPAKAGYDPTDYAWERWQCAGATGKVVRLRARGLRHLGTTDLVLSERQPLLAREYTSLSGPRALGMVNDSVLAFLDAKLRPLPGDALAGVLARYPEIERLDPRSLRDFAAKLPGRGDAADCRATRIPATFAPPI